MYVHCIVIAPSELGWVRRLALIGVGIEVVCLSEVLEDEDYGILVWNDFNDAPTVSIEAAAMYPVGLNAATLFAIDR